MHGTIEHRMGDVSIVCVGSILRTMHFAMFTRLGSGAGRREEKGGGEGECVRDYMTGDYRVCANWREDSRLNRAPSTGWYPRTAEYLKWNGSIDGVRVPEARWIDRRWGGDSDGVDRLRRQLVNSYSLIMVFERWIDRYFARDNFMAAPYLRKRPPAIRGSGIVLPSFYLATLPSGSINWRIKFGTVTSPVDCSPQILAAFTRNEHVNSPTTRLILSI